MDMPTIGVEEWLNVWERSATTDIAQSTIASLTMAELKALDGADGAELYELLDRETMNYGWIEGSPAFKHEVKGLYRKDIDPADILQTNGCTGANLNALMALVSPGDHVIAEWPTYAPLYEIPRALGAEVEYWQIKEELDWNPDIKDLERLIRPDTRLICINNASNPIGTILSTDTLHQLAEIAASVGAYVLCDEVYQPMDGEAEYESIVDAYERGIATNRLEDLLDARRPLRLGHRAAGGLRPHPRLSRLHDDLRWRLQRRARDLRTQAQGRHTRAQQGYPPAQQGAGPKVDRCPAPRLMGGAQGRLDGLRQARHTREGRDLLQEALREAGRPARAGQPL